MRTHIISGRVYISRTHAHTYLVGLCAEDPKMNKISEISRKFILGFSK